MLCANHKKQIILLIKYVKAQKLHGYVRSSGPVGSVNTQIRECANVLATMFFFYFALTQTLLIRENLRLIIINI